MNLFLRILTLLNLMGLADGGDDADAPKPPPDPKPKPGDIGTREERTFTQADMTATAAKEAKTAAAAERRKLAEELGMSAEEATAILVAHAAREEAAKDDVTKATEATAQAQAETAAALAQAADAQIRAELLEGMLSVGDDVNPLAPLNLNRKTVALALAAPVALAHVGSRDEAVQAGIDHVRAEAPEFFQDAQVDGGDGGVRRVTTPTGGRTGGERTQSKGKTALEQGADIYKASTGGGGFSDIKTVE